MRDRRGSHESCCHGRCIVLLIALSLLVVTHLCDEGDAVVIEFFPCSTGRLEFVWLVLMQI